MLLEEARTRARAAAVDAMNHDGLPPQTDQERRAVQAELAYLRTFSEVYRQHLRIYTEYVLRTIRGLGQQGACGESRRPARGPESAQHRLAALSWQH